MKKIKISKKLEEKIVAFCEDELYWHIEECEPREYKDEITAQIELLKLLGYENTSDCFKKMYKEKLKEDR